MAHDYIRTVFGVKRLSYPLAYFNGMGTLGVMTALAGLAWATHAQTWWQRALAIAPVPGVIVMTYLTYSRGSVLEMGVGLIVLAAAARHRISDADRRTGCGGWHRADHPHPARPSADRRGQRDPAARNRCSATPSPPGSSRRPWRLR